MGLLRRISELREQQIVSHAEPYLADGEEVLHWVRARNIRNRGQGFLFITSRRVVLSWTRGADDHGDATWSEIQAWGVNTESDGGPILRVEAADVDFHCQLRVGTSAMAEEVRAFLKRFANHAPSPLRTLSAPDLEDYKTAPDVEVNAERKTIAGHTKRILITVLGVVMVVGGILITPLPGPWSFPIIVGGLAVLATEYDWAEDLLDWVRARSKAVARKFRARRRRRTTEE